METSTSPTSPKPPALKSPKFLKRVARSFFIPRPSASTNNLTKTRSFHFKKGRPIDQSKEAARLLRKIKEEKDKAKFSHEKAYDLSTNLSIIVDDSEDDAVEVAATVIEEVVEAESKEDAVEAEGQEDAVEVTGVSSEEDSLIRYMEEEEEKEKVEEQTENVAKDESFKDPQCADDTAKTSTAAVPVVTPTKDVQQETQQPAEDKEIDTENPNETEDDKQEQATATTKDKEQENACMEAVVVDKQELPTTESLEEKPAEAVEFFLEPAVAEAEGKPSEAVESLSKPDVVKAEENPSEAVESLSKPDVVKAEEKPTEAVESISQPDVVKGEKKPSDAVESLSEPVVMEMEDKPAVECDNYNSAQEGDVENDKENPSTPATPTIISREGGSFSDTTDLVNSLQDQVGDVLSRIKNQDKVTEGELEELRNEIANLRAQIDVIDE